MPRATGAVMGDRVSSMGLQRQIFFWLLVLVGFIAFLLVFSSILLPFLAGMALAYFLDPVADRLERLGLSRLMATIAILVAFVVVLALSLMIIVPLVVTQAAEFIQKMPGYITRLQEFLTDSQSTLLPDWLAGQMTTIKQNSAKLLEQGASFLGTLFQQIWNSGLALLNILSCSSSPLSSPSICCSTGTVWSTGSTAGYRAITSRSCGRSLAT